MEDFFKKNKDSVIVLCSIIVIIVIIIFISTIKDNWWKTKFSVSNPRFIDGSHTIEFDVQNKTKKDYNVYVWYTITSGSLKKKTMCIYDLMEENAGLYKVSANSTTTLKCSTWDYDDSYEVKINKIEIKK